VAIALKNAVVPALSICAGVTAVIPGVVEMSFCSACSRGSAVRGSPCDWVWEGWPEEPDAPEEPDEPPPANAEAPDEPELFCAPPDELGAGGAFAGEPRCQPA
jgi:hypothetical protein